MLQRAFGWFSGLNLVQKVLAVLFGALLLFSASYLVSTAVLRLMGAGGERAATPSKQGAAPGVTMPGSSASRESTVPDIYLKISRAEWEGGKAVVEGTWRGDVSSVHCDLLEGGASGKPTRWWDREVPAKMSWSGRTFEQDFVKAQGREIEDPIDPTSRYTVVCSAQFSGGWQVNDSAAVKGAPSG